MRVLSWSKDQLRYDPINQSLFLKPTPHHGRYKSFRTEVCFSQVSCEQHCTNPGYVRLSCSHDPPVGENDLHVICSKEPIRTLLQHTLALGRDSPVDR